MNLLEVDKRREKVLAQNKTVLMLGVYTGYNPLYSNGLVVIEDVQVFNYNKSNGAVYRSGRLDHLCIKSNLIPADIKVGDTFCCWGYVYEYSRKDSSVSYSAKPIYNNDVINPIAAYLLFKLHKASKAYRKAYVKGNWSRHAKYYFEIKKLWDEFCIVCPEAINSKCLQCELN